MKFALSLFLAVTALAAPAAADTCLRIETHTDEYYTMGQTHAAVNGIDQIWFGHGKVAYITGNQKFVFDTGDSAFLFVNLADSSYAATSLPLDWGNLVSTDTYAFLEKYKRYGKVKKTDATRTVGVWACREYEIHSWLIVEDSRYNEREEKAYMSSDLPIDWDLFHHVHRDFLELSNYDDELIAEMLKIEGFSAATETTTYIQGFGLNSRQKVIDVSEKPAPPDLYGVPEGFRRKDRLTLEDING